MSERSNFWFNKNNYKKLNHINFMNFIFKKQNSFFEKFFYDFILLFNKKFSKFFSCCITIKFLYSCIDYHDRQDKSVYIKYIGKQFFLTGYTDKCLILITKDLFLIFINCLFGNFNDNAHEYFNNNDLTINEINILDVLLQKIFFICNKTFFKNISMSIINNCKFIELNSSIYRRFVNLPYICFIYKIYLNDRVFLLKIYIPYHIVEKFYR
ncbi:Flagellar motor switch protein FliM [Buchnera aphidicola (Cinara kochiana kochiana)]|uniref:Flagellar motor switch protein FliM n=1 Tax=Buchnera aphidicola (Cinara kochiana kochiana) TaxID=2518976 RepID=A0A451D547_9GAMM|nr:hypothetical protein [Buchnera aphidicola]VFP80970.1 Flagellar motor switch protein FliM [Buchnera aphidicola (Cinara kochiana kochiana)]